MALSSDQRASLWSAKLRALAREQLGLDGADVKPLPFGALASEDGHVAVLVEADPLSALGQALIVAGRAGARRVDLLVNAEAASVARRALLFDPSPTVHKVDGRALVAVVADALAATPPPHLEPAIAATLELPGTRTIVEHGVVTAECRGVEVARVTGVGDEQRVDVGVGAYDQGAFAVMHPELATTESLQHVLEQVLRHRSRGAEPHPLNRLVRERWLRAELLDMPSAVGLETLEPVEPVTPRHGLHDRRPAFALGARSHDTNVLVACSVGIDPELVPEAADVAARDGADEIVFVLPARDHHRSTIELAGLLRLPTQFVVADEPWAHPPQDRTTVPL